MPPSPLSKSILPLRLREPKIRKYGVCRSPGSVPASPLPDPPRRFPCSHIRGDTQTLQKPAAASLKWLDKDAKDLLGRFFRGDNFLGGSFRVSGSIWPGQDNSASAPGARPQAALILLDSPSPLSYLANKTITPLWRERRLCPFYLRVSSLTW